VFIVAQVSPNVKYYRFVPGINGANGLLVRVHDRIESISSRSPRAISLRLPARTFAGENGAVN